MLEFSRLLSHEDKNPYEDFVWTHDDILTYDDQGNVVAEIKNAEFPMEWSDLSKKTVANKYFRKSRIADQKETSLKEMLKRVTTFITTEGVKQKYFSKENGDIFNDELTSLLLKQMGTFNSPVWFNVGVPGVDKPQGSACFINEVHDSMSSILDLVKTEGLIFKEGSGSGVNFSPLRGSNEEIRGGGNASGPVSFMKGYDSFASIILSGGRTRRAARMILLDIDHPDIEKFITCKAEQEDIAKILVLGGLSAEFNVPGNAYSVVKHQSGNNSVSVTDAFMEKVKDILHGYIDDADWNLLNRDNGKVSKTAKVKKLFTEIAEAAHKCGDPGLQFYNHINQMNTCKNDGNIVASNPCLCGDMRLLTPSGYKTIKTLAKQGTALIVNSKGDIVESKIWSTGVKPTIQIHFMHKSKIPPLKCTPDHIWQLNDGTTQKAQDLQQHMRLMPWISFRNPQTYNKDAFLAGFIQGDGHTTRLNSPPHKGLEVYFGNKDKDIAKMYNTTTGIWYSNLAYNLAKKFGISAETLPYRSLPSRINPKHLPDFLAGLYSANGCIITNQRVALKTTCLTLAKNVQQKLKTLKIESYITTNLKHPVKFKNGTYICRESYDLNISKYTSLVQFAEKIGFGQRYKQEILQNILKQRSPAIESIKYCTPKEVFDFSEPKTHWGIVNGFVSHNCGEFVWLNNTSCNLASLNLVKFLSDNTFNTKLFKHAIRIFLIAQDILVESCGYPTKKITDETHKYRPLGLGYTNLGGLLMLCGIPYDSKEGRSIAAAITSLMTGHAYSISAELAENLGTFSRFRDNETCMEEVLDRQQSETRLLTPDKFGIHKHAITSWKEAMVAGFGKKKGEKGIGFRNAQVTLLAPTGTISWMMGAASTGIEPDYSLKKNKKLIDGSTVKDINPYIEQALLQLGYTQEHTNILVEYATKNGHLEGSIIKTEHLPVFDCAQGAKDRKLSIDAHLDMVAAVQPFLSGAVSKTCNLTHNTSVKDVMITFLKAWERKIKCMSIYREGSKLSEPMRVREVVQETKVRAVPKREKLPRTRNATTHKFSIMGQEGYLTIGLYPDGRPGEIFISMAQHGSTITGLLNAFSISCSIMLQYGISLEDLALKFKGIKFIPAGMTDDPDIRQAESIIDYIFKRLELDYGQKKIENPTEGTLDFSAQLCPICGNAMIRTGNCLQCPNCSNGQGVCS